MNKLFLFFILLSLTTVCFSQTYCYKYVYSVDDNDAKTKNGGVAKNKMDFYLTFTQNKTCASFTDKNGISSGGALLKYIQSNGDILTYKLAQIKTGDALMSSASSGACAGIKMSFGFDFNGDMYVYCNPSYSRLNIKHSSGTYTHVYERVSSPESNNTPNQLY